MKTYFVEIVYQNEGKKFRGSQYLRCNIQAHDKDHAKQKALEHYVADYTGGDKGEFYVQCCWFEEVPTREILEKHWEAATKSYFPSGVRDNDMEVIGYKKMYLDEDKEAVLSTWDSCNARWASPSVYYNPQKGGYMVQLHNHMNMPCDFVLFEGNTKDEYDKALKFVDDNTFKSDYYRPIYKKKS